MYENNHHNSANGNSILPGESRSRSVNTAIDSDNQPQGNEHELARKRIRSDQRIAVLIDSETLEITVENMFTTYNSEVKYMYYPEWRSIVSDVANYRRIVRMIYYKKQSRPINYKFEKMWTEELGGEVRQPEKSVDPYLIIDAITLAEKVDAIVLLAGDKDYLPLIWYLKSRGCKVEVTNFRESTAHILLEHADHFRELSGDRHVLKVAAKY
ncbi:MAG: hypothetical protein MAG794_00892 [Gammaproteobacteria bacterium]|nr:hypothetical protein [Gammaproteobacteria bacterium]